MTHPAPNSEREMLGSSADADTHRAADDQWAVLEGLAKAAIAICKDDEDDWFVSEHFPQLESADAAFIAAANPATVLKLIDGARASQVGMEREARNEPSKEDTDKFKSWFQPAAPKPDVAGARERLLDCLRGPHEWGYRCPVEGGFIADDRPYQAADEIQRQGEEIERLRGSLDPSGDTKAAYHGAFRFPRQITVQDEDGELHEATEEITVPWGTVKDIMKAIAARARQGGPDHG